MDNKQWQTSFRQSSSTITTAHTSRPNCLRTMLRLRSFGRSSGLATDNGTHHVSIASGTDRAMRDVGPNCRCLLLPPVYGGGLLRPPLVRSRSSLQGFVVELPAACAGRISI